MELQVSQFANLDPDVSQESQAGDTVGGPIALQRMGWTRHETLTPAAGRTHQLSITRTVTFGVPPR